MVFPVLRNWSAKRLPKTKTAQCKMPPGFRFLRLAVELLECRCLLSTVNTWVASGSSGNWNTASNWSLMHVPDSTEIATFDGSSSAACFIDAPMTGTNSVSGINITLAYATFLFSESDLNIGADGFIQAGGLFEANKFTLTVAGDWSQSSPAGFGSGSGTVDFDGEMSTNQLLDSGNSAFNKLLHSGAGSLELSNNPLVVTASLTNAAGTLDASGLNMSVGGLTKIGTFATLQNSGVADTLTFNGGLALSDNATLSSGLGVAVLGGDVTASVSTNANILGNLDLGGANRTFTVDSAFLPGLVISAPISNGALSKAGLGSLVLLNMNSYSGGTIVSAGLLGVGANDALGPGSGGTTVASGAQLVFTNNVTYTIPESIQLNGGSVFGDSLTGTPNAASFSGPITLGATGSVIDSPRPGTSILTLNGSIDLEGFNLIFSGSGDIVANGPINGTNLASIAYQGFGSLALNGVNNYGGGTTVAAGTLLIGNDSAVGSGMLTLENGVTTFATGADHRLVNNVTLDGMVTIGPGPNTLDFHGTVGGPNGSLTLNGNLILGLNNSYGGGTTVNMATLGLGGDDSLGTGTLTLNDGSTIYGTGVPSIPNSVSLNGSATVAGQKFFIEFDGQISGPGSLNDTSSGRVILTAKNTFTGGITVQSGGILDEAKTQALGLGTLTLNDGATLIPIWVPGGDFVTPNPITLNGTAFIDDDISPGLPTLAGDISGTGGLTLISPSKVTVTGNNTFSGTTTINAGALFVMGSEANSSVIINNGGTLAGTGIVGPVTANSGGAMQPGQLLTAGTLVAGNLQFNGGTLRIQANGTAAGTGYSQLRVNGTINLGAGLASLQVDASRRFDYSTKFIIIDNLGPNPVGGFFAGLAEGTITTDSAGNRLLITYQGGDGNDVVATVVSFIDIAGRASSTGQWWLGISNGSSFANTEAMTWSTGATWVDVRDGDFNGDGFMDFAGRYLQTGQWWVSFSIGSGGFNTTMWTTWNPNVTWVDVQVGDFNGDGKADIVGRLLQTGQWWVAESTDSGFTNSLWATWNPMATWVDVKVGDFNGDGNADITGRHLQSGAWWTGISTGSTFTTSMWATWNPNVSWADVNVGDFDGDGKADIAGRYLQAGSWWTAHSTGSSFTTSIWGMWNPAVSWVDVKVGDFNGDGKDDIIGRVAQNGQWWAGISSGTSFGNSLWSTWSTGVTWVDVQVGDFNGDGKADITGRALQTGGWWTGISNGSAFTTSLWATWSTSVSWVDVRSGDFA